MDQLKVFQVALSLIPGIGNIIAKNLISYCGSAEKIFSASRNKLLNIPGVGYKIADGIRRQDSLLQAEIIIKKCLRDQIRIIFYTEDQFPYRLKELYDSPVILYVKGNGDLNPKRSVGIVGTRQATNYGKSIVDEIVKDLVPHNTTIVSGLAYGIDYRSHIAAIRNKLQTFGIIGGGHRNLYPAIHKKTAQEIEKKGFIISEYEPAIMPESHFFPERNRIIAGLSDVLIVIEAAERGGALITAEYANNYNREVFAVPGDIHSRFSEGCNHLIKKHKANILTSVKDIEYIMNWNTKDNSGNKRQTDCSDLSLPEKKILEIFQKNGNEILIDDLSWKTQIPINLLASHLLNLEFRGFIKSLPGKKFKCIT